MKLINNSTIPIKNLPYDPSYLQVFNCGLICIPSCDSNVERFVIEIEHLKNSPFFNAFHRLMNDFFRRNGILDNQISYVIWGGGAANILLNLIGKSGVFYSYHDIEMFFSREGKVYQCDTLINLLKEEISSNRRFLLNLGGLSIVSTFNGISVEDFQKKRVNRNDGDILLNNIILNVDRIGQRIFVEAPQGTITRLIMGENVLKIKDASDLQFINQFARRIYRNTSKLIRYQHVTNLSIDVETIYCLNDLIKKFSDKLSNYFNCSFTTQEEKEITEEWIADTNINSIDSGKKWLYIMTLSETYKRLAGLLELNNLDQAEFSTLFLNNNSKIYFIFNHPLIRLVQDNLNDSIWLHKSDTKLFIAQTCYLSILQYQKPGAERLIKYYSVDNEHDFN